MASLKTTSHLPTKAYQLSFSAKRGKEYCMAEANDVEKIIGALGVAIERRDASIVQLPFTE